jgi:hypothetical protein
MRRRRSDCLATQGRVSPPDLAGRLVGYRVAGEGGRAEWRSFVVETERPRSEREVILEPRKEPLASLEELTEACLPTLTARLWATCCWSATMTGAWKIGDHNFLIAEVRPDPETCLYVQFWSEPHVPVVAEVCSGEWNPGAVKYA